MFRTWRVSLLLVAALLAALPAANEARAARFGRNKVQYGAFEWTILRTEHFDVYYYEGSEDLAEVAGTIVERANEEFEAVLGHELSTVIPVIVYASHNDFRQTNVSDSHISETVGGFTELFKNRVVVPFTGSYEDLRHVLYHELTHVFMFDIVYGGLVESVIRQAYMNPVPLWFVEGLAEYVSQGWDTEAEMILRDLTLSDNLVPLEYLWGGYLVYKEGQSALCFMAETYGPEKVEEMVKTVSRTHNLERALMDAIGLTTAELSQEWQLSLKERYWPEVTEREQSDDVLKLLTDHVKENSYINFGPSITPDGQRVAFLTDRSGYSDIFVVSTLDGKVLSRPVRGERSDEFETLHVLRAGASWSPDGTELCFVAKAGAGDALHFVDGQSGELRRSIRFDLDGMFTPSWSPDGESIVFVGTSGGASDLYVTDLAGENLRRLTDDFHDERDPEWSPDGREVAFASDRDAPLREDLRRSYDLYVLDVATRDVRVVLASPANESSPVWSPDGRTLAFVSDRSGSPQLHLLDLEASRTKRVTHLAGGVSSPSWARDGDRLAVAVYGEGGWDIGTVKDPREAFADSGEDDWTPAIDTAEGDNGDLFAAAGLDRPCAKADREKHGPVPPDAGDLPDDDPEPGDVPAGEPAGAADEEFAGGEETDTGEDDSVSKARSAYRAAVGGPAHQAGGATGIEDEDARVPGSIEKYRPRFSPDWVTGGFAYTSGYGVSGTAEIAVSDVLGNHRFYVATNFFSTLESSNFQVLYQHLANRLNLSLGIYNFKDYYYSDRTWLGEDLGEKRYFSERSYGMSAGVSYPFSMFSRVELDVSAISVDRRYAQENEDGVIELTDEEVARSLVIPSIRLVNDTTIWGSVGPVGGGRSSVVLQRAWETGGDFAYLTAIADYRRYLRMGARHSLAVKLVAARSSAKDAQNFYMGGVNSLRGYDDFEFHGRNLALASLEFRYPFIDHLQIASPLPLTLWGLRGVMFVDAGAAWDDDFRGVVSNDPGRRLEDIKLGYGFGVRANLSIFVVRVDWAWPTDLIDTGDVATHFALGAEF